MIFYLGKALELVGLSLTFMALLAGLVDRSMSRELTLLLIGAGVFLAGLILGRQGRGSD